MGENDIFSRAPHLEAYAIRVRHATKWISGGPKSPSPPDVNNAAMDAPQKEQCSEQTGTIGFALEEEGFWRQA